MKRIKIQPKTKFSSVIITSFTLLLFISCSPARQDSGQTQQVPALPPAQQQPSSVNNEPAQSVQTESTAQTPAETENSEEVMLNPPHGEPFHRCDIPVGAPLNSAPANTTRQTTSDPVQATAPRSANTAPNVMNNPTAPTIENALRMNPSQARNTTQANTGTKPRLNPPHGQPWHRCDIAVGSPLP